MNRKCSNRRAYQGTVGRVVGLVVVVVGVVEVEEVVVVVVVVLVVVVVVVMVVDVLTPVAAPVYGPALSSKLLTVTLPPSAEVAKLKIA